MKPWWPESRPVTDSHLHPYAHLHATFFLPDTWTKPQLSNYKLKPNVAYSIYALYHASEPLICFSPPEVPWPAWYSSVEWFFITEINHDNDCTQQCASRFPPPLPTTTVRAKTLVSHMFCEDQGSHLQSSFTE